MPEIIPAGHTLSWPQATNISSQRFHCWFCGNSLASDKGWPGLSTYSRREAAYVCICHYCHRPTFIDDRGAQHPGVTAGNPVEDIGEPAVAELYDEARAATGAGAYTASVLCCRKLLMHIAVAKGATPGNSFVSYVEYLAENNYIPPDARDWVDHIRKRSNEANHEILIMSRDDSEEILAFSEMLLKVIFQFPAAIRRKSARDSEGEPA